jgi:hypothetical protein
VFISVFFASSFFSSSRPLVGLFEHSEFFGEGDFVRTRNSCV